MENVHIQKNVNHSQSGISMDSLRPVRKMNSELKSIRDFTSNKITVNCFGVPMMIYAHLLELCEPMLCGLL